MSCRTLNNILGPCSLDAVESPQPVVTTKNVSRHRQMSLVVAVGRKISLMSIEPKVYLPICILLLVSLYFLALSIVLIGKYIFFHWQFLEEIFKSISPTFRPLPNAQYPIPLQLLNTFCSGH